MKLRNILKCPICGKVIYCRDKNRVCSWCGGEMTFVEVTKKNKNKKIKEEA